MAFFAAGLRRMAVPAPAKLFVCNQYLRQAPKRSFLPTSSVLYNAVRAQGFASTKVVRQAIIAAEQAGSTTASTTQQAAKRFFPETTDKSVAWWLLGSAASVFGIVVFGGLTRLTESGFVSFFVQQYACLRREM